MTPDERTKDPETNREAWAMIGEGIGCLGAGLSYFFVKKKRAAALLWPVAIGIVATLWVQVGAPLLEKVVADTVKIERVAPVKSDSLHTGSPQTATDILSGTLAPPEAPEGNVARLPGNSGGVTIVVGGVDYSKEYGYYADTSWQSWKLAGRPTILIYNRKTGDAYTLDAPALEEHIQEQQKK